MSNVVESAVKQPLIFKADGKEYTIEYPLSSVIQAEAKLGRPLKGPNDWFGAHAKDVPALFHAGLRKHHPDVTEDEVKVICEEGFGPETYTLFTEAIGAIAFPRWLAQFQKNLETLKETGKSPNVPSADAL